MSVFTGDFLGFQLGDFHSVQLNITRVSSGDRYSETLTPDLKHTTTPIPGGDGTYYWDTYYSQKNFTIDFAFDDLRDEDLRRLKQELSKKGLRPLIFDETPWKKYMVVCSSAPNLKYIAFSHLESKVYKGEGSIQLTAFYPFGMATKPIVYDKFVNNDDRLYEYDIINDGDLPSPPIIRFMITSALNGNEETGETPSIVLYDRRKYNINGGGRDDYKICELNFFGKDDNGNYSTYWQPVSSEEKGQRYALINMRLHLIENVNSNFEKDEKTTLCNRAIRSGDFFEIPVGEYKLVIKHVIKPYVEFTPLYY